MSNEKNIITFDLQSGEPREKMLSLAESLGVPKDEAIELLDISISIARKNLSNPKFSSLSSYFINLTPRLIFSTLGEKFTRDERMTIDKNFPDEGKLILDSIQDPKTKEIMTRFALSMREVIKEMGEYHLREKKSS